MVKIIGYIFKGDEPIPIFNRFVIQLLIIMFFIEFVKGALLLTILPVYMGTTLGLSTYLIGWSLALQYIGDNMFRSPMGWVIDRIGYRYSMLAGVLVTFLAVVMIGISTNFSWIVAACLFLGIGTSPIWPCVITGGTESAGTHARGTIMSAIYLAWLAGVGLGPIVINFFVDGTYRYAFQLLMSLMGIATVISLFLPSKSKPASTDLLQDVPHTSSFLPRGESRLRHIKQYFTEVRQSLTVSKLMFPAMFMQTFALGLLVPVLTLYARTELHLTPVQYSYLLMTGGLATVIFLIPIGKMVDHWGSNWFLHIGFAMSASVLLLFSWTKHVPLIFILVGILGVSYALIIPAWNALIAAAVPSEKRGAVWGFFLTIEGSGMVVGPIISGRLWDTMGPAAPFMTSGFVLIILLIVHIFISSRKKVIVQ